MNISQLLLSLRLCPTLSVKDITVTERGKEIWSNIVDSSRPDPGQRKKINLNFYLTLLCGFIKLPKRFEALTLRSRINGGGMF